MKKIASIILAGVLALSLLVVGVSAVDAAYDGYFNGAIRKGTAKVDGVLDEAYKYSFCLKDLGTADNAYGTEWPGTCTADVYFLYDDATLYICALVEDDDVLTKGEIFATGDNPYDNDNIEFRVCLDGSGDTIKVAVDAYGYACYGLAAHYDMIDYSTIKYATNYTDTSYVVEVGIPCTKGSLDMIKAGELGFAYQLNDIDLEGKHYNHTTSFEGEAVKMPVFVTLSTEKAAAGATLYVGNQGAAVAPETQAPETEAPETEAPETQAPETQAPETEAPETVADETVADETVADETVADETVADETVADETVADETVADETVADETVADETVADETEATETDEPKVEDPAAEGSNILVPAIIAVAVVAVAVVAIVLVSKKKK